MGHASARVERLPPLAGRLVHVAVPVALAVVTWFAFLTLVGFLLRQDSLTAVTFTSLVVVAVMLWPVYDLRPWRSDPTPRVLAWLSGRRYTIVLGAALGLLAALPFVPGFVSTVLTLPFRVTGFLFGPSLFYRERFGALAGLVVLRFGQWYLEAMWLYLLAGGVRAVAGRVR